AGAHPGQPGGGGRPGKPRRAPRDLHLQHPDDVRGGRGEPTRGRAHHLHHHRQGHQPVCAGHGQRKVLPGAAGGDDHAGHACDGGLARGGPALVVGVRRPQAP
ncbi:unnamed protein product, partial [Heterosigma akashiwo]